MSCSTAEWLKVAVASEGGPSAPGFLATSIRALTASVGRLAPEDAARRICAELVQVAPVIKEGVACSLIVELAASAPRVLLPLGARHPGSTAVLGSGVLGLDSLVSHDHYDTCCLH